MKSTIKRAKLFRSSRSVLNKLTAALMCLTFALSFSGCNDTKIEENVPENPNVDAFSASSAKISVGYSADDSLNPYFMSTDINTALVSLVFEPLFYVDDAFEAVPSVAKSFTADGAELTVKLDKTAVFSDGVQISSSDAVYSFELAKSSKQYKSELSNIKSAVATDSETVRFTLAHKVQNPADSLVFPVVKSMTADTAESVPIGTGLYKYVVSADKKGLEYNPYSRKPEPSVKTVELSQIADSSTLIHMLELGTIDAFFDDMSSGSYSHGNALNTKTNLPNLVFLGMNSVAYGLTSNSVRQAVFYSINRQSVVKNAFKNYAVESYTPFHPDWHVFEQSGYDTTPFSLDYSKATELMRSAGYKDKLKYSLVVYAGNNFKVAAAREISENLKNIGMDITVRELTWSEYTAALQTGNYDFYIGEIKLSADMNMSSIFTDNSVVYGISSSDTTKNAYGEFRNGNINIKAFTDSFMQNMPFAPICFRMGAIVYGSNISPAADCDHLNAYKNVYEWNVSQKGIVADKEINTILEK